MSISDKWLNETEREYGAMPPVRRLIAEVRAARTRSVTLTEEERAAATWAHSFLLRVTGEERCLADGARALLDRLLSGQAAPAVPTLDAQQRAALEMVLVELQPAHAKEWRRPALALIAASFIERLLKSAPAASPSSESAPTPTDLSATLADIDRMTAQLRRDREVPAGVMSMSMDAAARINDPSAAPSEPARVAEEAPTFVCTPTPSGYGDDGEMAAPAASPSSESAPLLDFAAFVDDKAAWSAATFGPQSVTGLRKHIDKELAEIDAEPGDVTEWCDLILLAIDGATRHAKADGAAVASALVAKMAKNKARTWPDWRTLSADDPREHVRVRAPVAAPGELTRIVGSPEHVALWDAINAVVHASGGRQNTSTYRMRAVAEVESALEALVAARTPAVAADTRDLAALESTIKAARTALSSAGFCGDGNLAEMIARALEEAGPKYHELRAREMAQAMDEAERALPEGMEGTIAERVRKLRAAVAADPPAPFGPLSEETVMSALFDAFHAPKGEDGQEKAWQEMTTSETRAWHRVARHAMELAKCAGRDTYPSAAPVTPPSEPPACPTCAALAASRKDAP